MSIQSNGEQWCVGHSCLGFTCPNINWRCGTLKRDAWYFEEGGVVLYSIYLNVYTLLFIRFNSEYSCLFICTIGNAAIGHSIIVVICVNDGPGGYTSATHLLFVCWGSAFICLLVQTMSFLSKYVHLCLSPQATQWACNGERFAHHYYMRQ